MVKLTKKQFENRLLFLQKLYYGGYITEAEKEDLGHPITSFDGNNLWCHNITSIEHRHIIITTNYKGLGQIVVEDEFMVFEDENGNLKYDILEDK